VIPCSVAVRDRSVVELIKAGYRWIVKPAARPARPLWQIAVCFVLTAVMLLLSVWVLINERGDARALLTIPAMGIAICIALPYIGQHGSWGKH
jgi:hypothetical protein